MMNCRTRGTKHPKGGGREETLLGIVFFFFFGVFFFSLSPSSGVRADTHGHHRRELKWVSLLERRTLCDDFAGALVEETSALPSIRRGRKIRQNLVVAVASSVVRRCEGVVPSSSSSSSSSFSSSSSSSSSSSPSSRSCAVPDGCWSAGGSFP